MKSAFNLLTIGCTTPGMYNIQETYYLYLSEYINISAFTVLLYSIALKLPQEKRYIWLKQCSLPALLYIFTKYSALMYQGLNLLVILGITTRLCAIPNEMGSVCFLLFSIGMQGLWIARAYVLAKRSKILAGVLVISCSIGLIAVNLDYSTLAGLLGRKLLSDIYDASFIFTDLVAFCVSIGDIWSTWKLKREAGLQKPSDITTILLTQGVIRCSLVIVVLIASAVSHQVLEPILTHAIENLGLALTAIVTTDFILDLRQCNSATIEASIATLPTIQFQNILQHVHQSIIVELGTPMYTMPQEERGGEDCGISEPSRRDDGSASARAQAVLGLGA